MTYHRDLFSEHMLLHPMSAPMTLRWLTDRFAGRPLDAHIIRTHWPTLLNPMTYAGMWRLGGIVTRRRIGRPRRLPAAVIPRGRKARARSWAGHAPRSSRGVATASNAYTRAAIAAGNSSVVAICSGPCAKNTGGASVK